jgi:hypothetical protein
MVRNAAGAESVTGAVGRKEVAAGIPRREDHTQVLGADIEELGLQQRSHACQ